MTAYVALLRGVNVAGRTLKMEELRRIGSDLGLGSPRTFIASGNLLFRSGKPESVLKHDLERALGAHMGAAVAVLIRTADELAQVIAGNPFAEQPANRVVAIFLDEPPPADAATSARNVEDERLALGTREIYVHYPQGQGRSKLRIPAASRGTARNMNTVAKLAELAMEMV